MSEELYDVVVPKLAMQKSQDLPSNNLSSGYKLVASSPAGNQTPGQYGLASSSSMKLTTFPSNALIQAQAKNISIEDVVRQLDMMEETLSKSGRMPLMTKNSLNAPRIASGSSFRQSSFISMSRQDSAAPDQISLATGSPSGVTMPKSLANWPSDNGVGKIPDSIPEESREEKPGRLLAELDAHSRMDVSEPCPEPKAEEKKVSVEGDQTEVTRPEPMKAVPAVKENRIELNH